MPLLLYLLSGPSKDSVHTFTDICTSSHPDMCYIIQSWIRETSGPSHHTHTDLSYSVTIRGWLRSRNGDWLGRESVWARQLWVQTIALPTGRMEG